jgi:hypothetical protein
MKTRRRYIHLTRIVPADVGVDQAGLILHEERDILDACTVYTTKVRRGVRIGIVNPHGGEMSVILDPQAFKRLFG